LPCLLVWLRHIPFISLDPIGVCISFNPSALRLSCPAGRREAAGSNVASPWQARLSGWLAWWPSTGRALVHRPPSWWRDIDGWDFGTIPHLGTGKGGGALRTVHSTQARPSTRYECMYLGPCLLCSWQAATRRRPSSDVLEIFDHVRDDDDGGGDE